MPEKQGSYWQLGRLHNAYSTLAWKEQVAASHRSTLQKKKTSPTPNKNGSYGDWSLQMPFKMCSFEMSKFVVTKTLLLKHYYHSRGVSASHRARSGFLQELECRNTFVRHKVRGRGPQKSLGIAKAPLKMQGIWTKTRIGGSGCLERSSSKGRGQDEAQISEEAPLHRRRARHSVNEGFGKEFYRNDRRSGHSMRIPGH